MSAPGFRESQPALILRYALGASLLTFLALALALPDLGATRLGLIAAALVDLALLRLLWTMHVEVGREAIEVRFGPGLFRARYPLAELTRARLATTRRVGMSRRSGVTTWVVWPGRAVELEMRGGRIVRIGSAEPDRLLRALRSARPDIGE